MKKIVVDKIEEFVIRVMKNEKEANPQEVAILPEMLKILKEETTGKSDGQ